MVRLILISIVFFFGTQAMSADCGKFKVVKGDVSYKQKSKKKFRKAKINKTICQGDTVKTAANSRAKVVMADQNEINISPETELLIEVYKKGQKAVLNVINGKVRSNVKQKYKDSKQSHYRVKTKSAVAGVRGTEFMASYNSSTNQSKVVTFEGEVNVGRIQGGKVVGRVSVKPGQFTSNSPGQDPHPAKEVPPAELAQMDRETNVGDAADRGAQKGPASTQPEDQDDQDSDKGGDDKSKNKPGKKPNNDGANSSDGDGPAADKGNGSEGKGNAGKAPKGGAAVGAPGVDGPDSDADLGDSNYRDDEQYGDPQFEEGGSDDSYAGDTPDAGYDGGADDRGPASVDGGDFAGDGGGDMKLPPPDLSEFPSGDALADVYDPTQGPSIPTLLNPVNLPEPCLTCNDAIINQKVRVIIRPILPGTN